MKTDKNFVDAPGQSLYEYNLRITRQLERAEADRSTQSLRVEMFFTAIEIYF